MEVNQGNERQRTNFNYLFILLHWPTSGCSTKCRNPRSALQKVRFIWATSPPRQNMYIEEAYQKLNNHEYNQLFKENEMTFEIEALKKRPSIGSDLIHNQFLIKLLSEAKSNLIKLYSFHLQCIIPEVWNTANIFHIQKPIKKTPDQASYRPICLLSCADKLMERVIEKRLNWIL